MKKVIIIFCLLFGAKYTAYSQSDSTMVKLVGFVFSEQAKEKLSFVHIINTRTGTGVISDTSGYFKLNIQKTDTLVFQCLGFKSKNFFLPQNYESTVLLASVNMEQTSYNLAEVDVFRLTPKNQFKYDFKNMRVEPDNNRIMIPGVTKYLDRDESVYPISSENMTFITGLYYQFSKKGKSMRKLKYLLEQDEAAEEAAFVFNNDVLYNLSGFSGDTLQAFFDHLNIENEYILANNEYTIYKRVLDSLPAFKLKLSTDTAFFNAANDSLWFNY